MRETNNKKAIDIHADDNMQTRSDMCDTFMAHIKGCKCRLWSEQHRCLIKVNNQRLLSKCASLTCRQLRFTTARNLLSLSRVYAYMS